MESDSMNFGIIYLINILSGMVILVVFKKIILSDFINNKVKLYFLRDNLGELFISSGKQSLAIEIKDGKIVNFNEYGLFIIDGFLIPLEIIIISWPFIYYFPNNLIGYCLLNYIFIVWYQIAILFIRFKIDKSHIIINEKFPYLNNYITFPITFNRLTIINIGVYVFMAITTKLQWVYLILLVLIIKFHLFIFIDKIDKIFNCNSLKTSNLKKIRSLEKVIFCLSISAFLMYIWYFPNSIELLLNFI